MKRAIIANITWNDRGWTYPEIHKQAGHKYVKDKPGHECLNFVFNKPPIDSNDWVHGHFQRTNDPKEFEQGGLIIFYSYDIHKSEGKIVGVYGVAEVIKPIQLPNYPEFEDGKLTVNIRARPDLSLRFPVYLRSSKYFRGRAVGQVGFSYIDERILMSILSDEIQECEKSGSHQQEIIKLVSIYRHFTGEEYSKIPTADDIERKQVEKEFAETRKLPKLSSEEIEQLISNYSKNDQLVVADKPQKAVVNVFERNPKLAAVMKAKNNYLCQVCGQPTFEGIDGNNYVESHHVIPRGVEGADDSRNIIIVCPNCHKKFDRGSEKTQIEVYRLLRRRGLFSAFDVLRNRGVISERVYTEIMKD